MSMQLATREVNEVTILDLGDRITLGEESGRLRDAVREIIVKGSKKIIVNLGNLCAGSCFCGAKQRSSCTGISQR